MTEYDYVKYRVLSDTLFWTKYFFVKIHERKFNVADQHEIISDVLDRVFTGELKKVLIRVPPRYGKTELAVKQFIAKGLAINPSAKFLHLSYSGELAVDNSADIKDIVQSDAYQELFPYVTIKSNSKAKHKWTTTSGGGVYATSTGGQVTGFGAGHVLDFDKLKKHNVTSTNKEETYYNDSGTLKSDIKKYLNSLNSNYTLNPELFGGAIVVDDPLKPEDALSDTLRDKMNARFYNTIQSRANSRNTPIIIIGQALHEEDLIGYLLKKEPNKWVLINLPAIYTDDDGKEHALYPQMHTLEELYQMRDNDEYTFETQYMQNPTPKEGLMYTNFRTYSLLAIPPSKIKIRKNYTDTADEGTDYLCSIDYIETEVGNYIINVLYTKKPMEYTEVKTAEMITSDEIRVSVVESNNGGRGFARNVESNCRLLKNTKTQITWFHQAANKHVRIFTKSADVQNMTYWPEGWEQMWPEFAKDIKHYRKEGKNKNDDGPDALTGTIEFRGKNMVQDLSPFF